jgi:hypothetical protein
MLSDLLEAFHRGTGQFAASKPERISGFVNETFLPHLLRELNSSAGIGTLGGLDWRQ